MKKLKEVASKISRFTTRGTRTACVVSVATIMCLTLIGIIYVEVDNRGHQKVMTELNGRTLAGNVSADSGAEPIHGNPLNDSADLYVGKPICAPVDLYVGLRSGGMNWEDLYWLWDQGNYGAFLEAYASIPDEEIDDTHSLLHILTRPSDKRQSGKHPGEVPFNLRDILP